TDGNRGPQAAPPDPRRSMTPPPCADRGGTDATVPPPPRHHRRSAPPPLHPDGCAPTRKSPVRSPCVPSRLGNRRPAPDLQSLTVLRSPVPPREVDIPCRQRDVRQ